MCGIAGIISSNTSLISKENLKKMTGAIAHRGPDGEDFWIDDTQAVGFGHRRLSIIDLSSSAAQPMHYLDRYTIVYNGEVYNYIEIKKALQKKGYYFKTQSDTEVILAAYDYWKEDCLEQFDGMFAFAIFDKKEQQVFAARDRFGEKPFYYYKDEDHFFFASEMKALWALGVKKEVNEKMLLNYLTLGYVQHSINKDETFFEGISSLPPSNYLQLSVTDKRFSTKSYWGLDKETSINISATDAIEHFTGLFTTSVKRRLRSDVSIGTSLSGGLDSSSIIATISQLLTSGQTNCQPVSVSAVFPGFEKNEGPYIQSVVDKFNVKSFTIQPTGDELVKDFEKICYHQEEPFHSSSIFAQYKVFELAASKNIKVLLDGQGADETMAGYHKYIHWYLQQLIARMKFTTAINEKKALVKNGLPFNWGIRNYLATFFPAHVAIMLEKRAYKKTIHHPDLTKDFLSSFQGREWGGIYKPIVSKLNDILYFNTMQFGLEELVRFADRNSMAHGREVRLPFLSHELVQFIFSLSANLKIHDGWTKWLLRKSMDQKLPDEIVWRKDKVGYEPPQQQWMESPVLQDYIQEAKRKLVSKGILNTTVLDKKIIPRSAHAADNYEWRYLCAAQLLA
jgi:asparagine synthase (glutamine-hydrolysing)